MQTDRRPRRELLAEIERQRVELAAQHSAMARGRSKGSGVLHLGAVLRQSLIDRSVNDLLKNPDTARWRIDAIVGFCFERQREIGLRPAYSRATLDRRVRAAIKRARVSASQARA